MHIYLLRCSGAIVLAFVLSSGIRNDAHAGEWSVCNKTPDNLTIAIGYADSHGGINTKGWWTLNQCGGCANVLNGNETADRGTLYLHAHANNGAGIIEGDESFCVAERAFTLGGAQGSNCGDRKSFRRENVDLTKNWTTNISGHGLKGNVCID